MKHFKLLNMQHKESCGLVMHAVFEGWGVIVLESCVLSSLASELSLPVLLHLYHPPRLHLVPLEILKQDKQACRGVEGYRHGPWGWGQVPAPCSPLTSWEPGARYFTRLMLGPHLQNGTNNRSHPIGVAVRIEQVRV